MSYRHNFLVYYYFSFGRFGLKYKKKKINKRNFCSGCEYSKVEANIPALSSVVFLYEQPFPVPGRPTIWITVGQGLTALAVGAVGVVWTFLLSSILSFLFLPLFRRRPDID